MGFHVIFSLMTCVAEGYILLEFTLSGRSAGNSGRQR